MRQLTAQDFVNKSRKKIELKDLGGFVYIKKLSVGDSEAFQKDDITDLQRGNEMIAMSVVDVDGNPVFTDPESLKKSSFDTYKLLTEKIMDYNDLSKGSTEEIEKN